jgi:hypothetical protein
MLDWLKERLNQAADGDSRRNQRIDAEILMIAERFSRPPYRGVCYDAAGRDWLVIPDYPLPARFQDRRCDLLIVFPETYPETPPIGFYLNKRFALRQGGFDPHATGRAYYGAPDLTEQGWHWYCVHMNMDAAGAWKPQPDHRKPDNLWTYLNMVREVLTNDG